MTEKKREMVKPGEKLFTLVLLAAALFMLSQALLLWRDRPGLAGPAAVPLLSSVLVSLLLLIAVLRNIKKPSQMPEGLSARQKIVIALRYVLSKDVAVALGAIVLYCALLAHGVSFYIVTPVFLWGLTTFFARGNYLKNLIPTALCMAFVYAVFEVLFRIPLP